MLYAEVTLILVTLFWGAALWRAYTDGRPHYPTEPRSKNRREMD